MNDIDRDIAALERQHERLRFARFDLETAWSLGNQLRTLSASRGHAMAIEVRVVRRTVFFSALPGSTAVNDDWVRRKRNTAELFEKSSYWVGRVLERDGTTLSRKMGVLESEYAAHGGAFPLRLQDGTCVGCATVSGIPQREDHGLLVQVLAPLCGVDPAEIQLPH